MYIYQLQVLYGTKQMAMFRPLVEILQELQILMVQVVEFMR